MARIAGKMRGDMRAMEIQANDPRTNPIQGGYMSRMVGAGATPSMGLSQFRGGGDFCDCMSGCGKCMSGGAHHRTSISASRMDASSPMAMGIRLRQHLHKLHGAGWFDSFKKGLSTAGTIAKYAAPFVLSPVAGTAVSAGLGALGFGRHGRRGAQGEQMEHHGGAMYPSGAYEGQGREREDEAFSGVMGRGGRRKRASAGPNDGRRARAEIVKRVMAEQGLSMIEASKHVKAHGLY